MPFGLTRSDSGVPESVRTRDTIDASQGSLRLGMAQGRCRKVLMLKRSRETKRDGVQVVGGSNPLAPTNFKNLRIIEHLQEQA
jgi:hypothetical protein